MLLGKALCHSFLWAEELLYVRRNAFVLRQLAILHFVITFHNPCSCLEEGRVNRTPFDFSRDTTKGTGAFSFMSTTRKLAKPVVRPEAINISACSDMEAMADVMEIAE